MINPENIDNEAYGKTTRITSGIRATLVIDLNGSLSLITSAIGGEYL